MILKEKKLINAKAPMAIAGQKQEQDVAFYLRRAFKNHEQVFVINDFQFSHNDETAQIDHLIVYPYGFVLIESKSITGEVKVNQHGEWSRSFNQKWSGIPSPIKQVELQQKLLKEYLHEHRAAILPKLFGIRQQSFGLRRWSAICAISSNAIIERKAMPKEVSEQIVKSEFIADKLIEIMNIKHKLVSALTLDTRPDFSPVELQSITDFLLQNYASTNYPEDKPKPEVTVEQAQPESFKTSSILKCKNCESSEHITPQYGRYGYFIHCSKCDTNTSMKMACPKCSSSTTKVNKRKNTYTLNCSACSHSVQVF
ncbi:nuclease-related domain-containing protein [Thalassotalea marina]|uniref:NERD domain-containing protein n=1 Tax=Thalassotalea marina TaxID=1673741 RepID=A0A919BMD0_9GAMM|nr:nuclease-related domain-containing protein [Thalassotalea marina]GHF97455.1 hypothetical protein GCM10017161_27040 [Thalassotalea marina]